MAVVNSAQEHRGLLREQHAGRQRKAAQKIGDKLTAADLKLSDKVKLVSSEDEILASVVVPQVLEEDTETAGEEAEVAPERVGDEEKSE